jgi:hypothetical protein
LIAIRTFHFFHCLLVFSLSIAQRRKKHNKLPHRPGIGRLVSGTGVAVSFSLGYNI